MEAFIKFIMSFFKTKNIEKPVKTAKNIEKPVKVDKIAEKEEIDWSDPEAKISKYFKVKEATYLPSWKMYHIPSKQEKKDIVEFAKKMDKIREIVGKSIIVHVWIRPKKVNNPDHKRHGQDYNVFIGSKSKTSGHITGIAVDFHVDGYKSPALCHEIRQKILPHLEELGLRMEDIKGPWIHIDSKPVKHKRFFKP